MKKVTVVFSLLAIVLLSACVFPMRFTDVRGSGDIVTEERHISGISSVELSGIGSLIIEQGDQETLEITADDNLMKYIESRIFGSNLSLDIQEFVNIHPSQEIVFHLTIKDLSSIETSGLGNVEVSNLTTDTLWVEISGAGSIDIDDLQADVLDLEISGMGDVDASGKVTSQEVEISGAGDYAAGALASREAEVQISGTGGAVIWVTDLLNLDMSGVGSLDYYGEPTMNTNISGVGSLKSLGTK